jgi:hypothetical protein
MKSRNLILASGVVFGMLASTCALAGVIPYGDAGTPNSTTYTFTAAATGSITAYFAGSGAAFDEQVGMLVNGVATGIVGLDDHSSALGDSLVLGSVTKGDTLTFFDDVISINTTWYSNPSLNSDGGNHVYSTSALAGQAYTGSPAGTYVGFEDEAFPGSDYNYHDDTFVFTNVSSGVPEPATWAMMLLGFAGLGFVGYRKAKSGPAAFASA